MKELEAIIKRNMERMNFDTYAVGVVDFKNQKYAVIGERDRYFDLASLTKPLTLGYYYQLHKEQFSSDMKLLLNHESGLPSWGRLSKRNWKEQLLSYVIAPSKMEYSDFGALRLMLEIEKITKRPFQEEFAGLHDDQVLFYKDLPAGAISVPTGMRHGELISGVVHDDNAYVIGEFCSHAGLFGTIDGLCRTLLKMNPKCTVRLDHRFNDGFDTVQNFETTLAGQGASRGTFGHLGFTGTSFWIDPEKEFGHIILTNATINYWYERLGLNELRRTIGTYVFTKGRDIRGLN